VPRRIDMIPDKHESIVRPVAMQVVRQLARMLKIGGDISLLFPGIWEEGKNVGSVINTLPEADASRWKFGERLKIEMSERVVEDRVLATAVHRGDARPIFVDEDLEVAIYPITVGTQMEFTITYRAESRNQALQFRDDITAHIADGRTDMLHEIDYHYAIPDEQIVLLRDIHELREAVAGYNETLTEYVKPRISKRATDIATLVGTQAKVAIREKQISPMGFFDFTAQPEAGSKDREGRTINVEFRYTFTYDQIIGCVAQYPLMVHGQLIQDKWFAQPRASGHLMLPDRRLRAPTLSRAQFDVISKQGPDMERLQYEPVLIPHFDDWQPRYQKPNTVTFFQAAYGITPNHPLDLFQIDTLEEFEFDPILIAFLKSEAPWACNYKNSIVYFELFENGDPLEDGILELTPDLMLRVTRQLNPRKVYHIQMRFFWHLMALTTRAREALMLNGPAAMMILEWLQLKLRGQAYVPDLIRDIVLSEVELERVGELLDRRPPRRPGEHIYPGVMRTAAQYTIIANRSPRP